MGRLLALLVAVALVGGALVVRTQLQGNGTPLVRQSAAATLLCVRELADVCEALAEQADRPALRIEVADAWSSVEALSAEEGVDADAWLTFAPFPQLVDVRLERAGSDPRFAETAFPLLARSPLVLAIWEDRAAVLGDHCGGDIDWSCIGSVAGRPWPEAGGDDTWGPVKPGFADPTVAAEGSLALAQAAGAKLGGPPSRRALDDSAFFGWFSELQRAVTRTRPPAGSPLATLPLTRRADYDVVGTTEAAALELLERAGSRVDGLTIRPSEPIITADVVVAPIGDAGGAASERVREVAPTILADHGWRVEGHVPPGGLTEVSTPEADPPPPGGLEALRTVWSEVRG